MNDGEGVLLLQELNINLSRLSFKGIDEDLIFSVLPQETFIALVVRLDDAVRI